MGLVPPEFCDFNPDCPIGRSCLLAGRSRAVAVSILHRACSIADCLTLLQRTSPDETTDMTTSHLTNPAKDAWQVIGYSHSTRLSAEELLAGHPKDDSLVAGYGHVDTVALLRMSGRKIFRTTPAPPCKTTILVRHKIKGTSKNSEIAQMQGA